MSADLGAALHRGVETALQRNERAAQPRLDRAERLAHLCRDLAVAEALEEREREALSLRRRELVDARRERTRVRGPAQQLERPRCIVGHGLVHVVVLAVDA